MHCHRLNHEDNGLMALINVIPALSTYAVAVPGSAGPRRRGQSLRWQRRPAVATVTPFPGYEGATSVAMGDVDDDNVLDLASAPARTMRRRSSSIPARASGGKAPFATELARFTAFAPEARGGVSVAAAQIDGKVADNLIVGSGAGTPDEVRIYGPGSDAGQRRRCSSRSSTLRGRSLGGDASVAGFVDFASGRTASSPRRVRAARASSRCSTIR